MNNLEVKKERNCNVIGDIFKNKILYEFICEYYEHVTGGSYNDLRNNKKFSPKFYDFIRRIFSDYGEYKIFLKRLRMSILDDSINIDNTSSHQRALALLAFDELHDLLSLDGSEFLDIAPHFQKRVSGLLLSASKQLVELDRIEPNNPSYNDSNSLYRGLIDAVKLGCAITDDGRIVYLQGESEEGKYNTVELGSWIDLEVNKYGTLIAGISRGTKAGSPYLPEGHTMH